MFLVEIMSKEIPVIWTEFGRKPGRYVLNSIAIHKEVFPNNPRYLVVSKEYAHKQLSNLCTVIFEEDINKSENTQKFNQLDKSWNYKHVSYWQNTTKRFFIIENLMNMNNFEKIIHLESDCVLLSIEHIKELFNKNDWGLKYTKQDDHSGCASIFLVNNLKSIEDFNIFIINNWGKQDINDMVLLHDYIKENKTASYLSSGSLIDSKIVYDAGTIGRYYLGGEGRNNRLPLSTRGLLPESSEFFDPSPFKVVKNGSNVLLTNIKDPDIKLELGCLHVHSKRIPRNYKKLIQRLINESGSKRGFFWRLGRPDLTVIAERVMTKVHKRVFFAKSEDVRFR
jgi:hypothetical protein